MMISIDFKKTNVSRKEFDSIFDVCMPVSDGLKVIPGPRSNHSYTFTQYLLTAVRHMKKICGLIENKTSFFEKSTENFQTLEKIDGVLRILIVRVARMGYDYSRNLSEFDNKGLSWFQDQYGADQKEFWEYPELSMEDIRAEYDTLIAVWMRIERFYLDGEDPQLNVATVIDDIGDMLTCGRLGLNVIDAV